MKYINYSSSRHGKFLTIGKLTLALNPFGNCFAPAVCLNLSLRNRPFTQAGKVCRPARAQLTLRSSNHLETVVYWRGGLRFDWNSAHLARRFGKFTDTDFGGVWTWRKHVYL